MLQAAAVDGERLERMLARRVVGEPLEQVLGWAEFSGQRIVVAPGVLAWVVTGTPPAGAGAAAAAAAAPDPPWYKRAWHGLTGWLG